MTYDIVKYDPVFKRQVAELQTHLWSPDVAANTAYLEWKYEANPYIAPPLIYLALCQGQVVGMRGLYGAQWQMGHPRRTFLGPCAADAVIAPPHRRRGLFRKMTVAALNDPAIEGSPYAFALSANAIAHVGLLAMGWRSVGHSEAARWRSWRRIAWMRARRYTSRLPVFWRLANHLPPRGAVEPEKRFYFLDRNTGGRSGTRIAPVSSEHAPRPRAMAELVERITGGDRRTRHVRDEAYFAWRFRNPLSVYRFLFWMDAGLQGYLILQTPAAPHGGVSIVDWEAADDRVRAGLLQAVLRWGRFDELTVWSATLPETARALLHHTGFRREEAVTSGAPPLPTVLVRPSDDLKTGWSRGADPLSELANWNLRMVDSDGY